MTPMGYQPLMAMLDISYSINNSPPLVLIGYYSLTAISYQLRLYSSSTALANAGQQS